jgi:hypothetical protein
VWSQKGCDESFSGSKLHRTLLEDWACSVFSPLAADLSVRPLLPPGVFPFEGCLSSKVASLVLRAVISFCAVLRSALFFLYSSSAMPAHSLAIPTIERSSASPDGSRFSFELSSEICDLRAETFSSKSSLLCRCLSRAVSKSEVAS